MRKIILSLFLCCCMASWADITYYPMSYFGKEYRIDLWRWKPEGKANFTIEMQADPEHANDKAALRFTSKNVLNFRSALEQCKAQFIQLKEEVNGQTDVSNDIPVKMPKVAVWYTAHNPNGLNNRSVVLTPKFVVFEDGTCHFVLIGSYNFKSNDGQVLNRNSYLIFQSAEEFDALINDLDPTR